MKEEEKSNNESDYIIFHPKINNLTNKKDNQTTNQKFINKPKSQSNKRIISPNKEININNEIYNSPFTNLILREKLNSDKFINFISNEDKLKLKLNNRNFMPNNSTKEFLVINKYKTLINNINENDKTTNKETKNKIFKNGKNNFNKNLIKYGGTPRKINKVSTGQQTIMDINNINEFKNDELNLNYKKPHKNNKNNNIINIPIRKKLTKNILSILDKNENNVLKINNIIKNYYNIKSNNNIDNKNNIENNNNIDNKNNIENTNNKSSTLLNSPNPKMKQTKQIHYENNKNNIINSEQYNYSKDNFDSISINDLNQNSRNIFNNKLNKTQRLIKNSSHIVSFDEVQIYDRNNFMSFREFHRQMISSKEKEDKNKKKKFMLKKKNLKNYLKKKNIKKNKTYKTFNTNLVSMEQYTFERFNKKKGINKQIKINDYINKRIKYYKNSTYYKYNIKSKEDNNSKNVLNENIFNNILKSISNDNNYKNKNEKHKNNKHSFINILTMLELNNKYTGKISSIN